MHDAETARRIRQAEIRLLLLLTLTNGVVGIDRLAASFLAPYLVADLGLSNTQIGLLQSSLSLAIAISAILVARIVDRTGKRRPVLIGCTILFSLFSALGGFATGFLVLLAARFALGLAEGPMVPISQAILSEESISSRRGFNMGFMQMTGAFLLGGMAGPVIATQVADALGWRAAFFLSAGPGLVLAGLLAAFLPRDPGWVRLAGETVPFNRALVDLARIPNMRVVIPVAILMSAWLMVQNAFLPLLLVETKGLAPATMGWVIGMGGLAGVIGGSALPALSDRIGRRPVVAATCFCGLAAPIALLLLPGSPILLALAILIGWLPLGIAPLFCAVIPAESAPGALTTTAIGVTMGLAELVGGMVAPSLAGAVADRFGLPAILWLCMACAVAAGLFALRLTETAPRKTPLGSFG